MQSTLPGGHILSYQEHSPNIDKTVFIAPTASIIGDVEILKNSSIWFGAVLRGDESSIRIGERTNIQDGVIIHSDEGNDVIVGDDVTVGHGAIIHGCKIASGSLIGMGAVVLDGAIVESGALVAAGAVVGPGKRVTANTLWAGCPARQIREFEKNDSERLMTESAEHYRLQALVYRSNKVLPV